MTDTNDEKKAEAIFEATMDMPTADRPAAIAAACGGNANLAAAVNALHEANRAAEGFLADPTVDAAPITERPGTMIGRYKLLQQIGEGGFGVVFMAEQEKPVRRMVALKVIKLGMDTREVVARFEAERQALAMMDHPNIAKVLDAGSTDTGRPYFVMELVRGSPVTEYCDKRHLSPSERVGLMTQICRAVQHAHSKGIIHRDLKPSNVLVTVSDDKAIPKVIDFGIAKATQSKLTDKTLFTGFRQLIGTPQYMSPEQADSDGIDVDTRTDVYSLGVLLYELLVGTTPFDAKALRSVAYDAMRKMIRETDPASPSMKLSSLGATLETVASARGTDARHLAQSVRGELDWIVMKALEKERTRRYDTAAALADDLERHLHGEPVAAGPPGGMYRLQKLARRHKAVIGVAAAVGLALLLGVVGTTVGLVRETHQKRVAEQQRVVAEQARADADEQRARVEAEQDNSRAVMSFMTDDVFGDLARNSSKSGLTDLPRLLSGPASVAAGRRFKDKPLIEAAVRRTLADTLLAVGSPDLALTQAEQSLATRHKLLGELDPETIRSTDTLARALAATGDIKSAEPLARLAWEHRDPRGGLSTLVCGFNYGRILVKTGQSDLAIPVLHNVSDGYRQMLGIEDRRTLNAQGLYAQALATAGQGEAAVPLFLEVWWEGRRILGYGNPATMSALCQLAPLLVSLHRDNDAAPFCQWVLEYRRMANGPTAPETIAALDAYASVLFRLHRYKEAEPLFGELVEVLLKNKPPNDTAVTAARDLADQCVRLRDQSVTSRNVTDEEHYAMAMTDAQQADQPGGDASHLDGDALVADAFNRGGHWDKSAPLYAKIISARRRQARPDLSAMAADLFDLANALQHLNRPTEAIDCWRQILDAKRQRLGPSDPETVDAASRLADVLDTNNQPADAAAVRAEYGVAPKAAAKR